MSESDREIVPGADGRGRGPDRAGGDPTAPTAPRLPAPSDAAGAVLAALGAAVRSVASEASLDRVLHQLAASARDLVGARYAAVGLPEPEGDQFARFVTVGMSDELIEKIGPLPRTHGLLAHMLVSPEPYRTDDVTADPRFGWWPPAHPRMRSFLGVPIVSKGDIVGAFYLADKEPVDAEPAEGGPAGDPGTAPQATFTDADVSAMALLASYAAVAVDHARLFEDSRELALAGERARLARELHDAMSQSLFGLQLAAEAAGQLLPADPARAADQLDTVRALAGRISAELREVVEGLRPADLERDGLVVALRSHLAVAGRAHGIAVELDAACEPGLDADAEHQVLRVVQEAVANALRHAKPDLVTVTLAEPAGPGGPELVVRVTDDGVGFDPQARRHRARRLGLTSMHERAEALGGTLTITSTPGAGTVVELRAPR